jgi:hypothetical protein
VHSFDPRRCAACGELTITRMRRFTGGWFFIRCPNCRRLLRVDPQHGQRWTLMAAFAFIGAAAIAGAAITDQAIVFIASGVIACALLYTWEFALTKGSPLDAVAPSEASEYRRNWVLAAVTTVIAGVAVAFLMTRL